MEGEWKESYLLRSCRKAVLMRNELHKSILQLLFQFRLHECRRGLQTSNLCVPPKNLKTLIGIRSVVCVRGFCVAAEQTECIKA